MESNTSSEIDLHELYHVLHRRLWIVVVCVGAGILLALAITRLMPKTYEAMSEIDVKTPAADDPTAALGASMQVSPDTFKQTQLKLITNGWMLERIRHNLKERDGIANPGSLNGKIVAKDIPDTELIDIYAYNHNAKIAQLIARETVLTFREYLVEVAGDASRGALETMTERVKKARQSMEDSSRKLADFQTRFGVLDLGKENDARIAQTSAMSTAAAQAQQDLQAARAGVTAIQRQLAQQNSLLRSRGVRSSNVTETLYGQLMTAEDQLAQARGTYVNDPDAIIPLQEGVSRLQKQLRDQLSKVTGGSGTLSMQEKLLASLADAQQQASALQSRYVAVLQELDSEKKDSRDLPYLERAFNQLSQNALVDTDLYQKTLESFEQIDMQRLSQPSVIQITGLADKPSAPVSPRPSVNLAFGIILGGILGLVLAVLTEQWKDSIHTEADLRRLAPGLGILGSLPRLSGTDRSPGVEVFGKVGNPYSRLWDNLCFASVDTSLRSIVVTSAAMGEGKSLICAMLGRAAAGAGRRTLIIDCDLHRPNQHRLWNIFEGPGIGDALAGKAALRETIKTTDAANLSVIPAGKTLPHNPGMLFSSAHMRKLTEELSQDFDLLIFDTPPVLASTDALMLGKWCQVVIPIVEAGRTRRSHIRKLLEMIVLARATPLGLVLNKVNKAELDYRGYYNYYRPSSNGTGNGNGNGNGSGPGNGNGDVTKDRTGNGTKAQ